jgi:hypothetical protein
MIPVLASVVGMIKLIVAIARLPRVTMHLGPRHGAFFYELFTQPHRHYPMFGQKTLGVALLRLPPSLGQYLAGKHRQVLRTNRNRCLKQGYHVQTFDPLRHRPAIDAIHVSLPQRQGRKMDYCQACDVQQAEDFNTDYIGVFAPDGGLVACACTPVCGQSAMQLTFIGHADHLKQGVMYALQAAVVEAAIRQGAQWLTYEGFFGQKEGMRYFLARCGYTPANVVWRIDQDA